MLNVGLQAGILNTRVFSMFVLHALVLTFITTPLTLLLYPARVRINAGLPHADGGAHRRTHADNEDRLKSRFVVVLDKVEQLPAIMAVTQLLQTHVPISGSSRSSIYGKEGTLDSDMPEMPRTPALRGPMAIMVDALRLIESDERTSTVLRSQGAETLLRTDPAVCVFRAFGILNHLSVSASLAVVAYDDFSTTVTTLVKDAGAEMVIVPWHAPPVEVQTQAQPAAAACPQFARKLFLDAPADVALFLDQGLSADPGPRHILLPFFGGPDARLALSFVVQLCMNETVSATVVRITKEEGFPLAPVDTIDAIKERNVSVCPS